MKACQMGSRREWGYADMKAWDQGVNGVKHRLFVCTVTNRVSEIGSDIGQG